MGAGAGGGVDGSGGDDGAAGGVGGRGSSMTGEGTVGLEPPGQRGCWTREPPPQQGCRALAGE